MSRIFEFCLSDWGVYEPYIYQCDCTKEEFEEECSLIINEVVEKLYRENSGSTFSLYSVATAVSERLSHKFKTVEPEHIVSLCLSCPMEVDNSKNDYDKWPEWIPLSARELIVKSRGFDVDDEEDEGDEGGDDA